jgi:formate C-acetyltransferase
MDLGEFVHHAICGPELARLRLAEQDRRTFPVSAIWRAESFRRTEGLPMTMRRSGALNAVLERCDLIRIPGELLLGSGHARLAAEGDAAALEEAREVLEPIGGRHFGTHADHSAPDYPTLVQEGLAGLRQRVNAACETCHDDAGQAAFLRSALVAVDGLIAHFLRWADEAEKAAESDAHAPLLHAQASMLRDLTRRPPQTLWEALQLVYLTHCAFQLDDRYAMALGRADQYLWPFYRDDVAEGRLNLETGLLLMEHFVAKLADRSDIQNVCVGGSTRSGDDAVNELSYLCVEAVKHIARPGANLTARISSQTPSAFVLACADCIRGGSGFPAVYNDDVEVPALVEQGYPVEDARDYCFVGCIEAFIPGKQAPWADSRFNLLKCVEDTVYDEQADLSSWDAFRAEWARRVRVGVQHHTEQIVRMEMEADARPDEFTSPLLSALTADCIARGRDVNDGGARYPSNHGVAGMGIGSTADALAAVRRFVYQERRYDLPTLRAMLRANFVGYEADRTRLLRDAPKYGNDDEEVDAIAVEVAAAFCREVLRYRTASGGRFWPLMAANVANVAAGREVGATPDGRLAGEPVSDAASPSFGRDKHGPTAVVRSIAKVDYSLAPGGNVVNLKLHPTAVSGEAGLQALAALIRTCFSLGGAQLQFNTVGREVLVEAMERPELHGDLVVRVSGFSAYFTRLERAVQEDVLARTEHLAL